MAAQITQVDIENWEAERKADSEWEAWRRRAARRLPDLAARVFALSNKSYMGSGTHYALVGSLGRMIAEVGDPTRSPFERKERLAYRLITQIVFEGLHSDLHKAEKTSQAMAFGHAGCTHAG
ncbi:hypothetical protein [Cupriavidus sp. TMH.W2]|uniref:hypothetical protein n=1 Tax=Cupriavidus sp. TMH.W2 TaxID=3434465 RepID=UPI003D777D55